MGRHHVLRPARSVLHGLALLFIAQAARAGLIKRNEELLIGWQGERYLGAELLHDPLHTRNLSDLPMELPLPASRGWVQQISWKPRAYIWHNFITEQEARHVIQLALPQMKRSTVVGAGGKSVEDNYRTSYGTFLRRYQDAVIERIENKVAAWTHIPVQHQEDIQVLRYGIGQKYDVHSDTLVDAEAGMRVATVLIYLVEPQEGGETAFPRSEWASAALGPQLSQGFSECAKGHVGMRPRRGDALLFWSAGPDGHTEDFHAAHTGCPVLAGAKWTMTKWIHARPFRRQEVTEFIQNKGVDVKVDDPGVCYDVRPDCAKLAENDGCERDRERLVVGVAAAGVCRLTCGACTVCAPDDKDCYNQNRRQVGFLVHDAADLA